VPRVRGEKSAYRVQSGRLAAAARAMAKRASAARSTSTSTTAPASVRLRRFDPGLERSADRPVIVRWHGSMVGRPGRLATGRRGRSGGRSRSREDDRGEAACDDRKQKTSCDGIFHQRTVVSISYRSLSRPLSCKRIASQVTEGFVAAPRRVPTGFEPLPRPSRGPGSFSCLPDGIMAASLSVTRARAW